MITHSIWKYFCIDDVIGKIICKWLPSEKRACYLCSHHKNIGWKNGNMEYDQLRGGTKTNLLNIWEMPDQNKLCNIYTKWLKKKVLFDVHFFLFKLKNNFIKLNYNLRVLTFSDYGVFIRRKICHQELKSKIISSGFKSGLKYFYHIFLLENRFLNWRILVKILGYPNI